jgi:hypothetical protein
LVVYDDEMHLDLAGEGDLSTGDVFACVRGNGPREGDYMGTATIIAFEDGQPVVECDWNGRRGP